MFHTGTGIPRHSRVSNQRGHKSSLLLLRFWCQLGPCLLLTSQLRQNLSSVTSWHEASYPLLSVQELVTLYSQNGDMKSEVMMKYFSCCELIDAASQAATLQTEPKIIGHTDWMKTGPLFPRVDCPSSIAQLF
ncbi:hypothetical protein RRG08_036715 [Elysia crispata]|uniref:Uncharacterized protein n=1 Tax=Elysia crispata TaxID=231223 RepID=A0AAE0XVB4_9GAST|nr:hypothetical protein RRG08_036715 [Elysia crispata]